MHRSLMHGTYIAARSSKETVVTREECEEDTSGRGQLMGTDHMGPIDQHKDLAFSLCEVGGHEGI